MATKKNKTSISPENLPKISDRLYGEGTIAFKTVRTPQKDGSYEEHIYIRFAKIIGRINKKHVEVTGKTEREVLQKMRNKELE